MTTIITFISIGVVIGIIAWGVLFGGENQIMNEKEDRKQKILDLIKNKGKVGNNDIEKLLNIADSTATKYLQQLENDNKIKQVGKTGRSVYYELK